MIQFSHRDEKITKLFAIIFWILFGFHIIFGCIGELILFTIYHLGKYQIVYIFDIKRLYMALNQWVVS